MSNPLPLIVLGGSDIQKSAIPQGLHADNLLSGFKGAYQLKWGRCVAAELLTRAEASGCFQPPIFVGPKRIYDGLVDCEIVNVEGELDRTLNEVVEICLHRFPSDSAVAFSSCDILPTPDEFQSLLETHYREHQECVFWEQLVEAEPGELGAGSWKPSYRIRPQAGQPAENLYPGHLVIARPSALRLDLIRQLLTLAYQYRNRPHHHRYLGLSIRGIGLLAAQDLRNLFAGQLPALTSSIPYYGLRAFFRFRRGELTLPDIENALARGFVHRAYQRRQRPVVISLTRILSFAKDIDTKAEFEEANEGQPCGQE